MTDSDIKRLLRRDEVAECLGASISTVVRLEKRGDLPRVKLGRLVRFRAVDVHALIDQHFDTEISPPDRDRVQVAVETGGVP